MNKFIVLLHRVIFFLSCVCVITVFTQNVEDNFPKVGIYNAEIYADPQPSNPKYIITKDGEKRYLGLACTFNKPVRWVIDDTDLVRRQYSMQSRFVDINNLNDTTSYTYEALMEVQFEKSLIEAEYLACVAYEDSTLMTFVSGKEVEDEGFTEYVVWNNTVEKGNVNNSRVLNKLIPPQTTGNSNQNCSLQFIHYDKNDGNRIYYDWVGNEYNNPWSVEDATGLENSHRKIPQIEEKCRKKLLSYGNVTTQYLNARYYQANVFHAENSKVKEGRVAKGVYSILKRENETRNFYFIWEYIPMEEMYYIKDLPDEVYDGQELNIETRVSQYFFSTGTVASITKQNEEPEFLSMVPNEPGPNDVEQGTRISTLTLPITKSKSDQITVQFYFPFVNSSKWTASPKKDIRVKDYEDPVFLDTLSEEPLMFKEGETNVEISCVAKGSPLPQIEFIKPRTDIVTNESFTTAFNESRLVIMFHEIRPEMEGNYSCFATNVLNNNATKFIFLKVQAKAPGTTFSTIIFAIFGVASIIFVSLALFLFRRIGAQKKEYNKQTEEAITEFLSGSVNVGKAKEKKGKKSDISRDSISSNEFELEADFEYNRNFEIPYASWHIGDQILGQGEFAIVTKGHLAFPDGQKIIAVKRIMSPTEIEDFKCALYELKLMSSVGFHPNILELVAACIDNIEKREVLMGLEYCGMGDLLSYLKKRRALFNNYVRNGELHIEKAVEESNDYSNVASSSVFTTLDLYKWSCQVANGMAYLESKHVIHGDLSARNLLLTDYKDVKICDFGLARQIINTNKKSTETAHEALPWKWMSMEALKDNKLSHKSDVWSFGVTLWEIFSLGEIPYPGSTWNPEFLDRLEKGMRLTQHKCCTNEVYGFMVQSWDSQAEQRPSFEDMKSFFMEGIEQMASMDAIIDYHGNSSIQNQVMEKKPLIRKPTYENEVQESQGTVEANGSYYLCSEKL